MIPIRDAEQMVEENLGSEYSVVNLSGYWVILTKPSFKALFDSNEQPIQSRSLPKAIRLARAVIDRDNLGA